MRLPESVAKVEDDLREERGRAARDILSGRSVDDDMDQPKEMPETNPSLESKLDEFNHQHVDSNDEDQNASSSYESDSSYESHAREHFSDDSVLVSGEEEEEEERHVPEVYS
jgi:hypothetical protein